MPTVLFLAWWSPFLKERHARLSLHAWRPETIPVVGWTILAHPCFPWPVHRAFRAAPASLRYPWRSQTWKGVSDAEVSAKPRSCLATPPEVTTVVAEERRTRSCGLWCRRREDAPAREVKARRASGAVLPRRRRRPEWAGGQSPRKRRRGQNGCGSLAWVSDEPWDPVGPGLVLPSASNVRLSGNDTRLGPCPWLLDVPGRCAGERGLGLSCVTHRPRGGR